MRRLTSMLLASFIALSVALAPMTAARAQTPSLPPPPYNVDIGPVITNSLRTAGTVTSSVYQNLANLGILCKFLETVSSGSPSTTFKIQSYDAATNSYSDLATSGAATGSAAAVTGQSVLVYPAAALTTTPTGWVLEAVPLPRAWRVSQTIAGAGGAAGPATTSKIGCNYLGR